ncbi:MAG TPA: carbonic anhydrase family protein [Leucothrix mucor]|uniref:Carbonic anhydrase n=1 Tax=Leucothrix mucor TaxID=45248 RepID=A0A7V2WV58_LEUMU|nr:carbonic anhydrase family protein [Leucothrix mucor]
MNKLLFSAILLALTTQANAEAPQTSEHKTEKHHAAHWGYEGDTGPVHWAEMSEKFKLCGSGVNQSPINIKSNFDVALPSIKFDYKGKVKKVVNNGHTIQVDIAQGSSIKIEGQSFDLKQFHFHTPSENTIDGKSFPLEAHFVHRNQKENTYAVVAVMFEEGDKNPILKSIWEKMPKEERKTAEIDENLSYTKLMPEDKDYYRFNGSFTTPPCTEGVKWMVLKKPMTASKAQIKQFFDTMKHNNNRNIQKTGARIIVD